MDDPLNPTARQQIEDQLKKQNEDFGEGDQDGEVIDIDEALESTPKQNLEETIIVNNDLNTTIITTDDE